MSTINNYTSSFLPKNNYFGGLGTMSNGLTFGLSNNDVTNFGGNLGKDTGWYNKTSGYTQGFTKNSTPQGYTYTSTNTDNLLSSGNPNDMAAGQAALFGGSQKDNLKLLGIDDTPNESGLGDNLSSWFGDKGNQAMIGTIGGIANIGLGLAGYLSQKSILDKQGKLLDQQISNNNLESGRRTASLNTLNKDITDFRNKNGVIGA